MRIFLIILLLVACAWLGYDDYAKSNSLASLQQQVEKLTLERDAARRTPWTGSPGSQGWFQKRAMERSSLEPPATSATPHR